MIRIAIFSGLILGVGAPMAMAADIEAAPSVYDWSGIYAGVFGGAAFVNSSVSDSSPDSGFFDNNNGEIDNR